MPSASSLVHRLSYRSADALNELVAAWEPTANPNEWLGWFGPDDQGHTRLVQLGLAIKNPDRDLDTDARDYRPTALGREVLALAKADRLRFYANGWLVRRSEFGKPADAVTIAYRDGRQPTEADWAARWDAMFAAAGV